MSDMPECDCPPTGDLWLTNVAHRLTNVKSHRPDCPAVAWINDTHSAGTIQRTGGFRLSPGEEEARQALDAIQALTERIERLEQNLVGLSDVIVTLSGAVDQLAKYITEETGD